MSEDFFKEKKTWSKYKDFILDYYLTPYLEKVKYLKRPILIVDCCAGPGMFDDGSEGSPLIIARHIKSLYQRGIDVTGLFLEKKRRFFASLESILKPYEPFAQAKRKDFTDHLDDIRTSARTSTVFLYVDPYGIKELLFSDLADIYGSIAEYNSSVEVLLNFNSPALVRCGLAALKMDTAEFDIDADDDFFLDVSGPTPAMTPAEVDAIAGGQYWRDIISDSKSAFVEKEEAISKAYANKMANHFLWVCSFPIQKRYGKLPKYRLIYGTRHEDGILLMNETMYKARDNFLKHEFGDGQLFDLRPVEESKNISDFTKRLFKIISEKGPMSRKDLKIAAMQEFFCCYNSSDYSHAVSSLLKDFEGLRLHSYSGKTRINDNELLSTKPFT